MLVRHSMILIDGKRTELLLINVTMSDIKEVVPSVLTTNDMRYLTEWPGGLCVLARTKVSVKISYSNFTKISSHCLGLKETALEVISSIFDNTELEVPFTNKFSLVEDNLDDNSGITWINIQDPPTIFPDKQKITIAFNKFIENKKVSKYGGVIEMILLICLS